MVSYYDLLLVSVPVVFVLTVFSLHAIGVSVVLSIPIAAFVSVLFVGHGLFINPPVLDVLTDSE